MEKMTYKLTTLSSVIASPRSNAAWYKDLGGFSLGKVNAEPDYLKTAKLKIIYPFYQYGEYTEYAPESAKYYLPGTSVKGMLCQGTPAPVENFMVDDVPVRRNSIVLRNLRKAQYLKEEERACFDIFFENVGVEMMKAGTELEGEIYIRDPKLAKALFNAANQSTKAKLKQMSAYLCKRSQEKYIKVLRDQFQGAIQKMNALQEADDLFLLGGYKGLLHSMVMKGMYYPEQKEGYAIYLDKETMLPHGLIKLELA